jgi:acetylglutamate kinase
MHEIARIAQRLARKECLDGFVPFAMLIVLKYGGNAMASPEQVDPVLDAVQARRAAGDRVVLVHGGGPAIDAALAERDLVGERIGGLRATGAAALEIVEAVLTGTVNKALVRALLRRRVAAVGLSGQDGGLLRARRAGPREGCSLGFVGEAALVDPAVLHTLLEAGFTPVVAPLALDEDGSSALNVNADTAAGLIAAALQADVFAVVTNVERIRARLDDPASELAAVDGRAARAFMADGTFAGGMRPKVESVLQALSGGARRGVVCGAGSGSLEAALAGRGGTEVRL